MTHSEPKVSSRTREAMVAYGFLLPNFLGFLIFTSIPVIASLVMAFMHWNIFHPPVWVGFENFQNLLGFHRVHGHLFPNDPFFWGYLNNTLYLMMAIPIGMLGSLLLALLMNQQYKGVIVFRTIYFLPSVCPGVAVLILWKYLLNADIGLLNQNLRMMGAWIFGHPIAGILLTVLCAVIFGAMMIGIVAAVFSLLQWACDKLHMEWPYGLKRLLLIIASIAIFIALGVYGPHIYGTISTFMGTPPDWLGTVQWSKPSLMLIGLWGGIGGYNMILYLAALQDVPRSIYEAAEMDGAGPWASFWSVTWPMISPTTFFILITSIIGGFQGGFMSANVLTGGGPAGSTTTLEYYLYQTAFEKFNMGYASAIAWFVFIVILILTLVTWRLGGKVVNYE